jgi:chitinase
MPASDIDFTALTHIIHFSVVPNADGTVNSSDNGVTTGNSADIVSRAHAAGVKVLICVGGADTESSFQGASSSTNLPAFINNLTNLMSVRGYDGVDIDWEPLPSSDAQEYTNLVVGLRSALNHFSEHKLLTAAAGAFPPFGDSPTADYAMFSALQSHFDQINIMTYDLSGPFPGWVTWFNSPISNGGFRFPSTDGLVPSVDGAVNGFLGSGVAANKLGIGVAFYGYIWTGGSGSASNSITQPRQSWTSAPTATATPFTTLMADYYQSNLYHWDTNAQSAYLGITNSNPLNNMFISYNDQRACQAMVSYVRNHGLGGVMIWELAQDHQSGQSDPLLQSIKQAQATPGPAAIQITNQGVALTFSAIALGSYRVQWTSNFASDTWHTLCLTNIVGPGQPVQVTDPNPFSQPQRFYRVQSPP